MNLSQLKNAVHKDERVKELRLRKDEVKIIVDVVIDHMLKGLLKYGILKLQGLFTLKIKKAKGRRISNPQTREHMYSKDYNKVGIEPSKQLREGLKNYNK
ncbi:MAG: HU family DNA-binding protein [Psychrobacillus sp.]